MESYQHTVGGVAHIFDELDRKIAPRYGVPSTVELCVTHKRESRHSPQLVEGRSCAFRSSFWYGDMGDQNTLDLTGAIATDGDTTRKLKVLDSINQLQQSIEDPAKPKVTADSSTHPFVKTRVSWAQRISNWFRGD